VVFDEWGHAFRAVREALIGIPWHSVSATPNSMSIFVPEAQVVSLLKALHASDAFKAVTCRVGLELITPAKDAAPAPPAERLDPSAIVGEFESDGHVHLIVTEEAGAPAGPSRAPRR
jgi:hypothetical protein